ncbi:MAG TPA: TonB-dependent receptor [Prevotella sp.]|nr:TonB-dependent receptor [Prevotella sp.]
MHKQLTLAVMALCYAPLVFAQSNDTQPVKPNEESAFTFTEAQLGEDDDMSQNVTIINSTSNIYASQVGYLFSPVRFRYRAFNTKYNDVYVNGALMNDLESGQFRFSQVGGLNQQTKSVDFSLPFENNRFGMSAMAGSNNYDFRAGSMAAGNRFSLAAANRNYTLRGMYTYASGFNSKGWAFAANLTYRWANRGYVEGTFYNALSYYLGVQKKWKNGHSLSFSTWGNPTERSSQGASTDEAYWLANDYYYNPYWGYQNGHKRNSRVINDFAPSASLTWDWDISNDTKLTTTLFSKYSLYKSTRLNYNNSENPQPDYWKNFPSYYYDIWDEGDTYNRSAYNLAKWNEAHNFWTASKANRQINWDRLYYANKQAGTAGADALYYLEAKHNDNLMFNLGSTLSTRPTRKSLFNLGILLGQNRGHHYKTMDDLLGATTFHNINTYAIGTYALHSDQVQYDLNTAGANNEGKLIGEDDIFGYDYALMVHKGTAWSSYSASMGRLNWVIAGKIGGTDMYRKGYMRNGMFANNSYGKSGKAKFLEGGGKGSLTFNAGRGHTFSLGVGYEWKAPMASTAFVSPEMNNDFVSNLKNERIFSSEFGYQFQNAFMHLNISGYFSALDHVTEWQNFYFDDANSFTYVSMTGIKKQYYGAEIGANFKLSSALDLKMIGTWSEAKNTNNAHVRYLNSTKATYTDDIVMNKDMRESGTPLTATSIGLSYHQNGWYIDLNENYYDRIYLSYSPNLRYQGTLTTMGSVDNEGNFIVPSQAKGHGGFMTDASIGRSIRLPKGSLNINLMVTNIFNNRKIVTGGYEQSRSSYTVKTNTDGTATLNNMRTYKFQKNPKKYYVFGTNGMIQVSYRF